MPAGSGRGLPWLAVAAALLVAAAAGLWIGGVFEADEPTLAPAEVAEPDRRPGGSEDPFAFSAERSRDFVERATLGYSHVVYEKSPGGVVASARRTAAWREEIERAARAHGADPDLMEAMVLLESAGRPDVIAGDDPEAASGLAQIIASTATDLLGMRVDLTLSQALTRRIIATEQALSRAERKASSPKPKARTEARRQLQALSRRARKLYDRRRAIDERFQPEAALDGMGRYLEIARERFGEERLAVASYHMGIGNLETVIDRYVGPGEAADPVGEIVARNDLDYPQIFFDSSPLSHERSWDLLASFGDDSSTYLWRVLAAERIMQLFREDPRELHRLDRLHRAKATAEEVFHPEGATSVFENHGQIDEALVDDDLVRIPDGADLGFRIDERLGELAHQLGAPRSLYRSLRPEALATLIYICSGVREIGRNDGHLTVTSAVRDEEYQRALVGINPEATSGYSLHTTGYSFDILREYRNDRQAEAFQFMLDRLRALAVIDYAVEPNAIHITVSKRAAPLLEAG